jgi:hypothetical protein
MFPTYLTSGQLWVVLWPIPVFALLFAGCTALLIWWRNGDWTTVFVVILAISMLGLVTGIITGNSRDSAVGAVLPAVLTIVGAIAIYIFTSKQGAVHVLASLIVLALSTNLLMGAFWGSRLRQDYEAYRESGAYRWQRELDEAALRLLRQEHGFPEPEPRSANETDQ